jgi:hypothetical protein
MSSAVVSACSVDVAFFRASGLCQGQAAKLQVWPPLCNSFDPVINHKKALLSRIFTYFVH